MPPPIAPGGIDVYFQVGLRGLEEQGQLASVAGRFAKNLAKEALIKKIKDTFGREFGDYYGGLQLPTIGENFFEPIINIIDALPIPGIIKENLISTLRRIQGSIYETNLTDEQKNRIRTTLKTIHDSIGPIAIGVGAASPRSANKLRSIQRFLKQVELALDVYWYIVAPPGANVSEVALVPAPAPLTAENALLSAPGARGLILTKINTSLFTILSNKEELVNELTEQEAREKPRIETTDTAEIKNQKKHILNAMERRLRILRSILQFYDTTVVKDVKFLQSILLSDSYQIDNKDMIHILEKLTEIEKLSTKYVKYSKIVADSSLKTLGNNSGENAGKQVGKVWSTVSTEFSTKLRDLKDIVDIASANATTFNRNMSINDSTKNRSTRIKLFNKDINLLQYNTANTNFQTADQANIVTSEFDWFRAAQAQSCERIVSSCRGQKSFLLLHAVGSGKSRTALCVAMNTHPSLPIVCLVIKGLETAFLDELVKDYLNEDVRKSLERRIRFVSYEELDAMAQKLRFEPNNKDYEAIFKNAVVLADEAHRLYPILENAPRGATAIPYEREVIEILGSSFKVVLMTATPIQKSWADFGRMINLMINLNNPLKKVIKDKNGKETISEDIVKIIPSDSEVNFRRNFAQDPGSVRIFFTVLYAIIFKYRKRFDERILSLGTAAGLVSNPASVVEVVDWVINKIGGDTLWTVNLASYMPIASETGSWLSWSLIPKTMALTGKLLPIVAKYALAAQVLNFIDNVFLDKIMNPPFLPMDLNTLVTRTLPYISFSDYKADEITHEILVKKYKELTKNTLGLRKRFGFQFRSTADEEKKIYNEIWMIETKLKDFPLLNIKQIDVPYTGIQKSLWHYTTQKGLTPSIGERHVTNLIEVDLNPKNGAITFSKPITTTEIKELVAALRCLGNISNDSFFLDTKLVAPSDKESLKRKLSISDKLFDSLVANGCYMAIEKDIRVIEAYLPDEFNERFQKEVVGKSEKTKYEKLSDIYGLDNRKKLLNAVDSFGKPIPYYAFQTEKYDKVLDLMIEARIKFHYLPVIYSNFEKRGMETFSAFLTSQGYNHIVLHTETPMDVRRERIRQAQRSYAKTPISFTLLQKETLVETIVLEGMEDKDNRGWPTITPEEKRQLIREYHKLSEEPVCVIVHPDLQEGLDLKFNEVMICLEPMLGVGNQEQVYGRIMRSMDKNDYKEYHDSYSLPKPTSNLSREDTLKLFTGYFTSWFLRTKVPNQQRITIIQDESQGTYQELVDHATDKRIPDYRRDTRKRINKYMFQIVSYYYDRRGEDPSLYYNTKFQEWKIWSIPVLGHFVGKPITGVIDGLVNLFYKHPKRIFINPLQQFEDIRGKLQAIDNTFTIKAWNFIKSIWFNQLPYLDHKFIYSYVFRLVLDMLQYKRGIQETKTIRKGEAVSYVNKGTIEQEINFPTSDLYYMNEIKTVELEYRQMRTAFRLVGDNDIAKLYEIGPYNKECDTGAQYYLDEFKGSKCKLLTGKSYSRKNVCSKVGPKLVRYTNYKRSGRTGAIPTRKLSFTDKMTQYLSPPSSPTAVNTPLTAVENDPGSVPPSPLSIGPSALRLSAPAPAPLNTSPSIRINDRPRPLAPGLRRRGAPSAPAPASERRGALTALPPPVVARPAPSPEGEWRKRKLDGGAIEEEQFTSDPVPNPVDVKEIQESTILTPEEKTRAIEEAEHLKKEYIDMVQKLAVYFQNNPKALENSKINSLIELNNPLTAINTSLFQNGGKKRKTRHHRKLRKHQSRKQRR